MPRKAQSVTRVRGTRTEAIERVQTGVRLEKRLLKVLKALAEYHDITLGDLFEGVFLHALEGKAPFSRKTLAIVDDLRRIYDFDLDASSSHHLREASPRKARR